MPAVNVARTDTFEQQRVKINQISEQVFSISAGGSDLSTGNLKLGNGSLDSPSLSFVNDPQLGLFRSDQETIGFVSASKKIYEFDPTGTYFYRDLKIQKKVIDDVSIIDEGENYDPGTYTGVPALKGAGADATLNIEVSPYIGTTAGGSGYTEPNTGGLGGPGGGTGTQFQDIPLAGGSGSGVLATVILSGSSFTGTEFDDYGDGYVVGDVLTLPPNKTNITVTIEENSGNITVSSTAGFYAGMLMTKISGVGVLDPGTDIDGNPNQLRVQSIFDGTTISTNGTGTTAGTAVYSFTAPWGTGTGYSYTIDKVGIISSVAVNNPGNGYEQFDVLEVNNLSLTKPIEYTVATQGYTSITFTTNVPSSAFVVGNTYTFSATGPTGTTNTNVEVIEVSSTGGIINYIEVIIDGTSGSVSSGDTSGAYEVDTTESGNKYTIDFGDGNELLYPDFEILKDNTYEFAIPGQHPLRFSIHPRGKWNEVAVGALTLDTGSKILNVASTVGVLPGMLLTVDNSVLGEVGQYAPGTTVVSTTSNTITISEFPANSGTATTICVGTEYEGTEVTYDSSTVTIQPSIDTPATLYYYCDTHPNMSGGPGYEAVITVNQVNPKVFGSGLEILVDDVIITDMLTADVANGTLTVSDIVGDQITGTSVDVDTVTTEVLNATTVVNTPDIESTGNLTLTSGSTNSLIVSAFDVKIGSELTITSSTGKIQTNGEIKTTTKLNVNDLLNIENSTITSIGSNNINLNPAPNRVVKIGGSAALIIPSGDTFSRPTVLADNGAIRFNTGTNQYEGYSTTSASWSSLGGVRDLDGNTYILAELSIGSNDNTLWFINDNINTVKFTPTHLEFVNQKSIRSSNVSAPAYTRWTANTPVVEGQYLKYKNNLYEVTDPGVTGTSGTEPVHTSGALVNGTCELTWYSLAVAPLTFEDIEVLRIGPTSVLPVSINSDLRLANNVISTDVSDLLLRPNSGKKVVIDAASTLAIPSGPDTDRGVAIQGSIRFSTTTSQFEGYDGTNWGSLGGVKDVDQNTYIIPELTPGGNQDTLYFYNNNSNTLQVTTGALDFYSIDTVRSLTSNEFELTASLLTVDNGATTLDNTTVSRTFLHTTKQFFDLGLSAGLTVDPVLRLDNQGDVYLNIGFGTGTYEGVKIFDGDLKEFELADIKILTEKITLVKGTNDGAAVEIYQDSVANGSKTTITAENPTTGDKEFVEYAMTDDGTDIFYTEYGNLRTGTQLFTTTFELSGTGVVSINIDLTDGVNTSEAVNITVVSNITKK